MLLGGNITIPTIDGDVDLKIPEGTQPGSHKTLKHRGMPKLSRGSTRGDQIVTVNVKMPKLSKDQKEMLIKVFRPEKASEIENSPATTETSGTAGGFSNFFKHFTDKTNKAK